MNGLFFRRFIKNSEKEKFGGLRIKNSRLFTGILAFFLFLCFSLTTGTAVAFEGGSGTEEDPYQIADVEQLQAMEEDLSAHYVLVDDIDASETETWNGGRGFEPIGNYDYPFMGTFDGQGYVIKNLYINRSDERNVGLFGCIRNKIRSVGLKDIRVTGGFYNVGGLVGFNNGISVFDSYATGSVAGNRNVGGLIGRNSGNVSESYFAGIVSGSSNVGGLVGLFWGSISNSYSAGTVTGDDAVGGLVGYIYSGSVLDSYATGNVNGDESVGGLVGYNRGERSSISCSYSTGSVAGEEHVGGLMGWDLGGADVEGSFWNVETSGTDESAAGTGKATEEMIIEETFLDAGWVFEKTWGIIQSETYPYLQWQETDTYPYPLEEFDLKIDIEGQGSTSPAAGTHTYDEGEEVTIGAIPDYGWIFDKWTGDVSGTENEINVTIDEDKSVTAVFEEEVEHYGLSVDIIGDGTVNVNPDLDEYEEGASVTLTAVPSDNFEFLEWSGDVTGTDKEITVVMDEDKEITANFEEEPYLPPDVDDEEGLPWMWISIGIVVIIVVLIGIFFFMRKSGSGL